MANLNLGFELPESVVSEMVAFLRTKKPAVANKNAVEILRACPRNEVLAALAACNGLPFVPGIAACVQSDLLAHFDLSVLRRGMMVPVCLTDTRLTIAIANPFETSGHNYCEQHYSSHEIVVVLSPMSEIEEIMGASESTVSQKDIDVLENYGDGTGHELAEFCLGVPENETVRDLLRDIFNRAIAMQASDVHFFTEAERFFYKYRVHGDLTRDVPLELKLQRPIDAVMLHLVGRSPEDGRREIGVDGRLVLVHGSGRKINCRYVRHRSIHGWKAVLRILDKSRLEPRLGVGTLVFDDETLFQLRRAIKMSDGILIMSGPTGSGKSTTLDAMIREVFDPRYNIVTLENPVEQEVPGVCHCDMQNNEEFPLYIRALMRADPDIIQIGEVRDPDSAALAVEAAITGHQVFTTIHTPSAAEILDRMAQLGIARPDLARTLRLLCAQRLLKTVCQNCATTEEITVQDMRMYGLEPADVGKMIKRHSPNGCTKCNNLGYSGRIAVMELLPIDREASEQIVQNNISALGLEVFIRARNPALKSLQTQGRELLLSGKTDAAALLDVINMGY